MHWLLTRCCKVRISQATLEKKTRGIRQTDCWTSRQRLFQQKWFNRHIWVLSTFEITTRVELENRNCKNLKLKKSTSSKMKYLFGSDCNLLIIFPFHSGSFFINTTSAVVVVAAAAAELKKWKIRYAYLHLFRCLVLFRPLRSSSSASSWFGCWWDGGGPVVGSSSIKNARNLQWNLW